jgi:hypothetical protein
MDADPAGADVLAGRLEVPVLELERDRDVHGDPRVSPARRSPSVRKLNRDLLLTPVGQSRDHTHASNLTTLRSKGSLASLLERIVYPKGVFIVEFSPQKATKLAH